MVDPQLLAPERIRPLKRVEYDRMVDAGLFVDERIELLRGVLVEMSPQGTGHADAVARMLRLCYEQLGRAYEIRPQLPFAASDDSEPEPDVMISPRGDYRKAHPERALLLIEVADSSLTKDRRIKAAIYAEVGVPEYWIVAVPAEEIEILSERMDGEYRARRVVGRDGVAVSQAVPGLAVSVEELFGEPR